jgi:hypothetical protein
MMNKPDNLDEITDIWSGVFEALSVSQFDRCFRELGFPFQPSKELHSISKDFVLLYYMYLGKSIPEQPSIQLPVNSTDDVLLTTWNVTFSRLQGLTYDSVVYMWGKQTYRNYAGQNNQFVRQLHWNSLLTDWANNPTHPGFEALHLSPQMQTKLQSTINRHDENYWRLRHQFEQIKQSSKTKWEEFAFDDLQVGAWMHLQAQFVAAIAKWDDIFTILSDNKSIETLQEWGWQQFERIGINSRVPLVRFST